MMKKAAGLSRLGISAALPAASALAKNHEATIKRDTYGVPHIYSNTLDGLYFGYGYALAQDRLYQIEIFRRTFYGRLSEIYGKDLLAFDQSNRRDNITSAEIQRYLKKLDREVKKALRAFAAGINACITEALADPENLLPKEFHVYDFVPKLWTEEDVIANFLSVMGFFMGLNAEMANASMLHYLSTHPNYDDAQAKMLFDDWCWGLDPDSPTTITDSGKAEAGNSPSHKRASLDDPVMVSALQASGGAAQVLAKEQEARRQIFGSAFPSGHLASYVALIAPSKSAAGYAMLMGGPQFGFELPSAVYEVGLHGAGIDAIGSTLTGYPFIMFGHNKRAAFSSTAGADNLTDVFAEQLNPDNPRQYRFNGKWKDMVVRSEVFQVKNQTEPVTQDFFYTVHGPVFYMDDSKHIAFSMQFSRTDGYVNGITSLFKLMRAESVDQFNEAAMISDMALNYEYADVDGNIAFYHLGLYPVRAEGVDDRLPTQGTGEFEWRGFIPKDQNPHQSNPAKGYFVNWNNQPGPGWSHGDLATSDSFGGWGADDRVTTMIRLVEEKDKLSADDLKNIITNIAFYDKRAINIKSLLISAVQDINPKPDSVDQALKVLQDWDNLNRDEDGNGFYDHAGSAIFDRWWYKAVRATFAPWYEGYSNPLGQSAVDILSNRYHGYTLFYRALNGTSRIDYFKGKKAETLYAALTEALSELASENPSIPVTEYRLATVMGGYHPITVLGDFLLQPITSSLEAPLPFPMMDRGTENHIVTLKPRELAGENITSPGNSGFVRSDGTVSPHFYDQVDMFLNFTYKPMLFTSDQVTAATASTQVVKWK